MIIFSFTLVFIGFVVLSLTMKRHYLQLRPQTRELPKRQTIAF